MFDVEGSEFADRGTILVLAGASASRNLSKVYTATLAQSFRVIRVDLPGHGVMHAVAFRCVCVWVCVCMC